MTPRERLASNRIAGWNLGNTLDAVPDEGRWNNPPVRPETFDDVKKAGFKSVRLPGESRLRPLSNLIPLIVFDTPSDLD
jgi:aryl-phospho-beta-D-glucosidase BglC (GH1 family)